MSTPPPEKWLARSGETTFEILVTEKHGHPFQAVWQCIQNPKLQGIVPFPLIANDNMPEKVRERAMWALLRICSEGIANSTGKPVNSITKLG